MSTDNKKSLSAGISIVVGVVLVAGGWALQSPTAEFAETMEKKGIPLNPAMTVAVLGVFFILFKVIEYFFINPLGEAIHERNANLEHTFAEAENLRAEMTKMRSDYETRLAQTEAAAREQIQTEIKKAQDLRTSITAEASARADELVRKAQEEISAEKAKVLAEIRTHVVDLTLQASAKVVGENMDNERNRRLVQEFIDGIEVKA